MAEAVISFRSVAKRFGELHALRGVSAEFHRGEVVMLIGPNASGKSTLIRSLLGLVRPDSGSIEVNGDTVGDDPTYRRAIGYMPQISQFPPSLTIQQLLEMMRDIRGLSKETTDDRLCEELGLVPQLGKPLGTLSGGTRQKVSAVLAFRSWPQVLVMDEPTAGLDPLSSRKVLQQAACIRDDGGTVLITSHLMEEVEAFADRVAYLEDGRLRFLLPVKEIFNIAGTDRLTRALPIMLENGTSVV